MEKQLGSLPVIADFSRRLDIAGIIDRACPMREVALTSHGQVVEALIANRLTSPKAMVAVADWAHDWAVAEVYGIDADTLNDDRLGRALDAIAPEVDQIAGSIGAAAIDAFGIDVSQIHWDMTVRREALVRREARRTERGVRPPRWVVAAIWWELGAA